MCFAPTSKYSQNENKGPAAQNDNQPVAPAAAKATEPDAEPAPATTAN